MSVAAEAVPVGAERHPLRSGPGLLLIVVSLLGSLGFGLYEAGSAVYFVRSVGLSATMVGASLSVAGFAGLFLGLPLGRLADRVGAKRVAVAMAIARTVPLLFAVWARSFWQVLLIVLVLGVAESGWTVAEEAMIAHLMAGAGRVRIAAYLRAVGNIGLTGGSLAAGVALAVGTRVAYQSLIWGYVATSVVGAVLYLRLPSVPGTGRALAAEAGAGASGASGSGSGTESGSGSGSGSSSGAESGPGPGAESGSGSGSGAESGSGSGSGAESGSGSGNPGQPRRRAVRDLPYMAVSLVSCLTTLGDIVLAPGLPLWIVTYTAAPKSLAAWMMSINTLLVALLQVRMARRADTIPGAMRSQEYALAAMVVMCVLAGLSGQVSKWPACALLVAAVVVLTFGEMWGQGARWAMRYGLAPTAAQGEYGAAFRLGLIVPRACGPVLVTGLTSELRFGGWLVLGALFAVAIAATRPVTGWAVRTRPAEVEMGAA